MHERPQPGEPEPRPIVTHRLLLKPPGDGGREALIALARHPGIADNLPIAPSGYSFRGGQTYLIVSRALRSTIGVTGFGPSDDLPGIFDLATWIGEPYWGKGYATEATQAVIDRAFSTSDIKALWCANRMSNTRGRRLMESCGLQFRGVGMARSTMTHAAMPVERFVLERRTWKAIKAWSGEAPDGNEERRSDEDGVHDRTA